MFCRRQSFQFAESCLLLLALFVSAGAARADAPKHSAQALEPVKLILQWTHQAQFAGYYAACETGIYAEYGLDVTILRGGPDRDSRAYLLDGRADFATRWLISALEDTAHGLPMKHIAQIINRSNLILLAWKDSGIKTIRDLDRRRVGLWEGQFRPPFIAFFRTHDIRPEIIQQNYSINLFLRRGVDACSAMYYNEYNMLFQAGIDESELIVFTLASENRPFPEDGIYCLRQTFEQKPQICRAMAEASIKGWQYAAAHPEEALDMVMRHTRAAKVPTNRAHMRWMLKAMLASIFPEKPGAWQIGRLSREAYAQTVNMLVEHGVITNAPDFNEFTFEELPNVP